MHFKSVTVSGKQQSGGQVQRKGRQCLQATLLFYLTTGSRLCTGHCCLFFCMCVHCICYNFENIDSHNIMKLLTQLTFEGPCIFFCNIYTFQQDTQCSSTDCLLMLRCQLYMFRTITVHPQELLFRCCMCRLWYVIRNALWDLRSCSF